MEFLFPTICVIGGYDGSRLDSVEVYDSEWDAGQSIAIARDWHAAVVYQGRVYVIGATVGSLD